MRFGYWLAAMLLALTASSGNAHAFVCGDNVVDPGEQCDDGNTVDGDCCSATCQFESAGADLDGDGLGDACDPDDAVLGVDRVQLKSSHGGSPPSGFAKAKGRFDTSFSPDDLFDPQTGVTVRIEDALGADVVHAFASCARSSVRSFRCRDGEFHADFRWIGDTMTAWRWAVKFGHQPLALPFQGPATVTITRMDIDRVGSLDDCSASGTKLTCRGP